MGRSCFYQLLRDYSVPLFWKLRACLEEKGQKKRKNKNLQHFKGLEDSRVDVVPECVLFWHPGEIQGLIFFSVEQVATSLFFRTYFPVLL